MSIRVAHVEAGLRLGARSQPFPEETNRTLIAHLSDSFRTDARRAPQLAARWDARHVIVTAAT